MKIDQDKVQIVVTHTKIEVLQDGMSLGFGVPSKEDVGEWIWCDSIDELSHLGPCCQDSEELIRDLQYELFGGVD